MRKTHFYPGIDKTAASAKMQRSMSGTGNCYDNAVAESFFATLKLEALQGQVYASHADARAALFDYIEVFYNRQRLHSSLGFLSPSRFAA
ncbi:transposase [bacterium]|nr:transposase [bacterium]